MTKEEFVAKWKRVVAGGFLYGYVDEVRLKPSDRAGKVFTIGEDVERLLGKMWDDTRANGDGKK